MCKSGIEIIMEVNICDKGLEVFSKRDHLHKISRFTDLRTIHTVTISKVISVTVLCLISSPL